MIRYLAQNNILRNSSKQNNLLNLFSSAFETNKLFNSIVCVCVLIDVYFISFRFFYYFFSF